MSMIRNQWVVSVALGNKSFSIQEIYDYILKSQKDLFKKNHINLSMSDAPKVTKELSSLQENAIKKVKAIVEKNKISIKNKINSKKSKDAQAISNILLAFDDDVGSILIQNSGNAMI